MTATSATTKSTIPKGEVYEVENTEDLDILLERAEEQHKLLILDTYAPWCGPCKTIAPFFAGLSVNANYKSWVIFAKVDVDGAEDVAASLDVTSMPTFFLFHKKKVEAFFSGASISKITDLLNEHKHLVVA